MKLNLCTLKLIQKFINVLIFCFGFQKYHTQLVQRIKLIVQEYEKKKSLKMGSHRLPTHRNFFHYPFII